MNTLLNRIVGNLATRIMLIIYVSIIFITTFFIIFSYYNELELQEQRQYDKLSAIVSSLAVNIDGDEHQSLMRRFSSAKQAEQIKNDPFYVQLSSNLSVIVAENKLSPMYTLVYDEAKGGFVYGVRSDDFVDFKNSYLQSPQELLDHMETGGVIPAYMSENGTWLSAFYPIRNKAGEVVALLEADIEFSEFKILVNERYFKEVMLSLGVIVALALLLIPYARKVLAQDEVQKKMMLDQKKMIESKNRDITASIRYALKIQSAILPSSSVIADNGLEGFILHKAKDIVAGDFYWMDRHGDELFFAVADCTGHGVPGAVISLVCANALNRAVDVMKLRNTQEILDTAREMIIDRLGKGENEMSDGMDISLCRLNMKTLELQFTGANNPIYIFGKKTGEIKIAKACKQPVSKHVNPVPFKCQLFQLEKGDVIYLFTDGFADQFGGAKGKKFKYKPFRLLLQNNATIPMRKQKERLIDSLREWMGPYEQVDDICIMGIRI